jgi:hypothetical protein
MISNQPKIVRFTDCDCLVQAERYPSSGHTALSLYDAQLGIHFATATLNLPDIPLCDTQVFIKDYSENEGMLAALVTAGIVKETGVRVRTGVGFLPICELLIPPPELEKSQAQRERAAAKQSVKDRDFDMDR